MTHLRIVVGAGAAAIAGLLGYGLAPSYQAVWGIGAAAVAVLLVIGINALVVGEEDSDPTIRPPNVPYADERSQPQKRRVLRRR